MQASSFNDNEIKGFKGWSQPYRFVISRRLKWDPKEVEVLQIADDPAIAYAIAKICVEEAFGSVRQAIFDYFLTDSFNKDATNFCKTAYDKAVAEGREFRQVFV